MHLGTFQNLFETMRFSYFSIFLLHQIILYQFFFVFSKYNLLHKKLKKVYEKKLL